MALFSGIFQSFGRSRAGQKELDESLFEAAQKGDDDKVRKFLEAGANVNAHSQIAGSVFEEPTGWTPLHVAAINDRKSTCLILLAAGANPLTQASEHQGRLTPLDYAQTLEHSDTTLAIATYQQQAAGLTIADSTTQTSSLPVPAQGGMQRKTANNAAPIRYRVLPQSRKNRLLFEIISDIARDQNREKRLGEILDAGADVHALNKDGDPIVYAAILHRRTLNVISMLAAAGADVNAKGGYDKESPLHLAVKHINPSLIHTLAVDLGADIEARNGRGLTPLIDAFDPYSHNSYEYTKVAIEPLLDAGANVNAKDNSRSNRSVLHYAALAGDAPAVRLLLDRGADVNAKSNLGCTPLIEICASDDPSKLIKIAEVLLVRGTDPALRDNAGYTALDYTENRNCEGLARLIRKNMPEHPQDRPKASLPTAAAASSLSPSVL